MQTYVSRAATLATRAQDEQVPTPGTAAKTVEEAYRHV